MRLGRPGEGWRERTWEEMKGGNRKEKFYNYISIKIKKNITGFLEFLDSIVFLLLYCLIKDILLTVRNSPG